MGNMALFKLDTVVDFGKTHKGKSIQEIIKSDPDWVAWAAEKIEWFELDEEAIEAVDIALMGGHHFSL